MRQDGSLGCSWEGLPCVSPWASVAGDDQRESHCAQSSNRQTSNWQPPLICPCTSLLRAARREVVWAAAAAGLEMMPMLSVLAPDHTGLTVQEQPSLYWYLSESTTYPVELTIIDDQSIQPLVETRISGPLQPGVQRVRLADYGMRLSLGVPYRWSVALVVDPDSRSRDIIAGGVIERIALPEAAPHATGWRGEDTCPLYLCRGRAMVRRLDRHLRPDRRCAE